VEAPGKPAEQGQRIDARRLYTIDRRGAEKKEKIADKSFYRIYAPNRGTKIWRNRESVEYNIYLGRSNTVSTNSNLRITRKTRIIY
jgi:hypothetical protein